MATFNNGSFSQARTKMVILKKTKGSVFEAALGMRLKLTCITKGSGFEKEVFIAPDAQRVGKLVEIDDAQIFLVLDHRLNDIPDDLEKRKAVLMGIESRRVLRIHRDKIDNLRFDLVKDSISAPSTPRPDSNASTPRRTEERSGSSYAAIARSGVATPNATSSCTRCYMCKKSVFCADCLVICNKNHYVCLEHMGIWDNARHRPRWEEMYELAKRYFDVARQHGRLDKFTEIRFLYYYSLFCKMSTAREMDMNMQKTLDKGAFTCGECQDTTGIQSNISIADLKAQLYLTEDAAASNFIPNAFGAAPLLEDPIAGNMRTTTGTVRCYECQQTLPRTRCFASCSSHYRCYEHLCLWDEIRHRPRWDEMTELATRYFTFARQLGRLDKFTEIRFLHYYFDFRKEASKKHSFEQMMEESLENSGCYYCERCRHVGLEVVRTLGDFREEFYLTEEAAASNFISSAYSTGKSLSVSVADNVGSTYFTPPEGSPSSSKQSYDDSKPTESDRCYTNFGTMKRYADQFGYSEECVRVVAQNLSPQELQSIGWARFKELLDKNIKKTPRDVCDLIAPGILADVLQRGFTREAIRNILVGMSDREIKEVGIMYLVRMLDSAKVEQPPKWTENRQVYLRKEVRELLSMRTVKYTEEEIYKALEAMSAHDIRELDYDALCIKIDAAKQRSIQENAAADARDRAVVAPGVDMTKYLPLYVYNEMLRRKYTEDEIKAIVNGMCIGDVRELDIEILNLMLESAKPDKPKLSPSKVVNPLNYLDKRYLADLRKQKGYKDEEISAVLAEMTVQEIRDLDYAVICALLNSARLHTQEQKDHNKYEPKSSVKVENKLSHLGRVLYSDVKRLKGYTDEEINAVLAGMTVPEIRDLDYGYLCAMLDSAKTHLNEQQDDYTDATTAGRVVVPGVVSYVPLVERDITVTVVQLSSGRKARVPLRAGTDYNNVTYCTRSKFMDSYRQADELRYYCTSSDGYAYELKGQISTKVEDKDGGAGGWTTVISKKKPEEKGPFDFADKLEEKAMESKTGRKYVTAANLRDGDTILIAALRDNICPRQRLDVIAADNQYNSSIQTKVKELEVRYDGWRGIRGDGNCFYRAVIFGLLEQLIITENRSAFNELRRKFQEADTHQFSFDDSRDHQDLLTKLQAASNDRTWMTVSDLEADVLTKHSLSDKSSIDLALIRACRAIVSSFLKRHQDHDMHGLPIKDAILPTYPDCSTIEDYCRKYVDVMGEDAEGAFVYMGLLQSSLNCSGVTVLLDARADIPLNYLETSPFEIAIDSTNVIVGDTTDSDTGAAAMKSSASIATIHLLLRPGHYDLLYPKMY